MMFVVFKDDLSNVFVRKVADEAAAVDQVNHWLFTDYKTWDEMYKETVTDPIWFCKDVKEVLDTFMGTFDSVEDYDAFIKELICEL